MVPPDPIDLLPKGGGGFLRLGRNIIAYDELSAMKTTIENRCN